MRTTANFISGNDTTCMGCPRNGNGVLTNPFSRGEGQADHEEGADEFMTPCLEEFAVANVSCSQGGGETWREKRGNLLVDCGEDGDSWHGLLESW